MLDTQALHSFSDRGWIMTKSRIDRILWYHLVHLRNYWLLLYLSTFELTCLGPHIVYTYFLQILTSVEPWGLDDIWQHRIGNWFVMLQCLWVMPNRNISSVILFERLHSNMLQLSLQRVARHVSIILMRRLRGPYLSLSLSQVRHECSLIPYLTSKTNEDQIALICSHHVFIILIN